MKILFFFAGFLFFVFPATFQITSTNNVGVGACLPVYQLPIQSGSQSIAVNAVSNDALGTSNIKLLVASANQKIFLLTQNTCPHLINDKN